MRVSVSATNYAWPGGPAVLRSELGRVAQLADEVGIHGVWVADHLYQAEPGRPLEEELLEAYTTLGFLAGRTERVQLGTMVSAVMFRPPAVLVKAVTTLDVLSGGRAWLGIGTGHADDTEARAYGLPSPSVGTRFEWMEETIQLALQMWRGDASPFTGKHLTLEQPVNSPNSVRRPHPPILIGGTGEKKTLRMVAQYADACNVFDIPDGGATVRRKLDVLRQHCEDLGRPYDEIEKTIGTRYTPGESPAEFAERCAAFSENYGIDHASVITVGPWTEESIRAVATAVS